MKKKLVAILAVIALVVTMLPTMVFADDDLVANFDFTYTPITRDNLKSVIDNGNDVSLGGQVFELAFFKKGELQYIYIPDGKVWIDHDLKEMASAPEKFDDIDQIKEVIYFTSETPFDTEKLSVTANGVALPKKETVSSAVEPFFTLSGDKAFIASLVHNMTLTSFEFTSTPLTRANIKTLIETDDFGISSGGLLMYLTFFSEGTPVYYYSAGVWFDANKEKIDEPESFNNIEKVTELILFLSDIEFDTSNCTVTANGTNLTYEKTDYEELREQTKQCFTFGESNSVMIASLVYDLGLVTSLDFTYEKLTRDNLKSLIEADDFGISSDGRILCLSFFKNGELKYSYDLGLWLDANGEKVAEPENFNDVDQVLEVVVFGVEAGFDTEKITVTANGTPLKYEEIEGASTLRTKLKQYFTFRANTVLATSLIHDLGTYNPKTADANSALPYACAALAAIALLGLGIRKIRREK